jgi:hypothetical protein
LISIPALFVVFFPRSKLSNRVTSATCLSIVNIAPLSCLCLYGRVPQTSRTLRRVGDHEPRPSVSQFSGALPLVSI